MDAHESVASLPKAEGASSHLCLDGCMDITTVNEQRVQWDFTNVEMRNQAFKKIVAEKLAQRSASVCQFQETMATLGFTCSVLSSPEKFELSCARRRLRCVRRTSGSCLDTEKPTVWLVGGFIVCAVLCHSGSRMHLQQVFFVHPVVFNTHCGETTEPVATVVPFASAAVTFLFSQRTTLRN